MTPEEWKGYVPTLTTKLLRLECRKYIERAFGLPLPNGLMEEVEKLENVWYECDINTSWADWLIVIKNRYIYWFQKYNINIGFEKVWLEANENMKVLLEEQRKKVVGNSKLSKAINSFTNFLDMAERFLEIQPLYYDKNKIWYMWDFNNFKWNIVDETDLLNSLEASIDTPMITINSKTKNEILEALRRRARQKAPKKPEKTWIQFKDKIVDVLTGNIITASPDYFVTCPIPYEIGQSEDTPMIDKYFNDWVVKEGLQEQSYVQTLYQAVAYSCLQDQFLQRLFAFTGSGSNGKGCFIQMLTKFLGQDNVTTSDMKVLTKNNFETSSFYQKQACFMGEVDTYDMANTTLLKRLTGEDLIRYEFKGKTAFSEKSGTTFFIATNSLPVSNDKSFGFYRRWLIIDFPNIFTTGFDVVGSIPEVEFNNLAKKIITIAKELYQKKAFANEGSYEQRTKKYEERSNPIINFIESHCEESQEDTLLSYFCKVFNEFCEKHRIRPSSNKQISKTLRNEGYVVKVKNIGDTSAFFIYNLKVMNITNSIESIESIKNQVQNPIREMNLNHHTFNTLDTFSPKIEEKSIVLIAVEELKQHKKVDMQLFINDYGQDICLKLLSEGLIMENPKGILSYVGD
jgi:P4 family phage/plasmid primase-like protien